ncbi:MAG TPA: hypothetical protein VNM48_07845 [Chloroflexota bacterium]|nr:hypothetical protein [Chloroflexota bacterium]
MPDAPRLCLDCGAALGGRRSAVRCRVCANRARKGAAQAAIARNAANTKHANDAENKRLAQLAREHGLA